MDPEKSTKLGEIGQDLMVPNTPCPYKALSGEYRAQMWFADFNVNINPININLDIGSRESLVGGRKGS